jgi:hypothetical protein
MRSTMEVYAIAHLLGLVSGALSILYAPGCERRLALPFPVPARSSPPSPLTEGPERSTLSGGPTTILPELCIFWPFAAVQRSWNR